MKLSFAKNTKRNLVAGFLNRSVGMVFPFLNRTLFLWLLGPEYLGLNGLFRSVLGVLSLAELGFGTAVVYAMYKPIAEDDREKVCAHLNFIRTAYRWIGLSVLAAGLALLPFLRRLVHGDPPAGLDLHVLYLIYLANATVSYFFFAYRNAVLSAHQRNDVTMHVNTLVQTVQYAAVFLVLLLTRDYYAYIATTVLFTVLGNVAVFRAAARLFPDIVPRGRLAAEERRKVVSDVKSIFLHKIGGIVSMSSDNIVISAFLGLAAVAAYGNYYYVMTTAASFVSIAYLFTQGGFGNKIHTESKEANFDLFMRMNRLTLVASAWCAAMMASLYQPFISIWTKGDPAMLRHALTPALMVFHFYATQSRQTLIVFKSAAGVWKQDRWKPLVGGLANIGLNLAFVTWLPDAYKLDGVIFSTTLSYLAIEQPWESRALFSSYFGARFVRPYWAAQLRLALFAAFLCAATWGVARLVPAGGPAGFVLRGCVAAAVSGGLAVAFHFRDVRDAIAVVRSRR